MLSLEHRGEEKIQVFPEVSHNASALFAPHFGLRDQPFASNLDRRNYFSHQTATELVNTLQYALRSGEGITKITGESGTGKTFLTSNLLASLSTDFFVIKLPNPATVSLALLKTILDELCVEYSQESNSQQLIKLIFGSLCAYYARYNHPVVLCIDNAERMPVDVLATLSILNNLETHRRKLLQVILIGNSELDSKLQHPSLASLRQRISFTCKLKPLTKEETYEYITHRLKISGNENEALFTRDALDLLFKLSGGIPRMINLISYKGMMLAFGQGKYQINRKHIRLAAADTPQAAELVTKELMLGMYVTFGLALLGCLALAVIYWIPGIKALI